MINQITSINNDNNDATKQILGVIGSLFAIFLFTSPFRDIFGSNGVYVNKNTNNLASGLPYIATMFNCLAWILYTAPEFSNYILPCLINIYGLSINIAYAGTYLKFTSDDEASLCKRYFIAGVLIIGPALAFEIAFGRDVMGYVAAGMNILMFFSPLSAASEVIKSKSVEKYPFLPLLFSFLCGASWTAYGIYTSDIPIIIRLFIVFMPSILFLSNIFVLFYLILLFVMIVK